MELASAPTGATGRVLTPAPSSSAARVVDGTLGPDPGRRRACPGDRRLEGGGLALLLLMMAGVTGMAGVQVMTMRIALEVVVCLPVRGAVLAPCRCSGACQAGRHAGSGCGNDHRDDGPSGISVLLRMHDDGRRVRVVRVVRVVTEVRVITHHAASPAAGLLLLLSGASMKADGEM